jgi:nitroreductase
MAHDHPDGRPEAGPGDAPAALPDADAVLDAIATTRAIRRYRPDPIPDADLARVLFAATRAPSGSNRQPFRFLVLRDGPVALRARVLLGSAFRAAWEAKRRADGYEQGSGREPSSPKARTAAAMAHYVEHFEQIPVVVLACLVRYRDPTPTEGASVYPACQNLLLAARALGYGGVLSQWHLLVEPELRDVLRIPPHVALSATITLGRPAGHHGAVRRRPLRELVFEDAWGEAPAWAVDPPGTRFTSAGPPPARRRPGRA